VQASELQPGVDCQAVLREALLLRKCAHARIVPLFGIAVQVSTSMSLVCHPP